MSSATSQGRGGGDQSARGPSSATTRARGIFRGSRSQSNHGRGRGRGALAASASSVAAQGIFRGQTRGGTSSRATHGHIQTSTRGSSQSSGPTFVSDGNANVGRTGNGLPPRGSMTATRRARGSVSRTFNTPSHRQLESTARPASPAPGAVNMENIEDRLNRLKTDRETRKKQLIRQGVISDPDKKTTLENAITPVGACTDFCPELERIQRIRERATDPAERVNVRDGRGGSPSEALMVKRFRRSAAGNEEQLPEDIRTPETLQRTLNYLLDKVIGGSDRLVTHQKYVWDRTRAIRNDFSIQQVTKPEDVKIAVDCYERIARFHILCLHLLSNEANTNPDEKFEAHQEREQLNNTLLSLMYYYDDNRHVLDFPNEAEFRAYGIIFELQALGQDIEDRVQSWPTNVLNDPRVKTALKLYAAAGDTEFEQGPLRPYVPAAIAQANSGKFWTLLHSPRVSYLMACVAEINFPKLRFTTMKALWQSAKNAPERTQATMRSWTISAMTEVLAFDDQQQTEDFCALWKISFKTPEDGGDEFLDFQSLNTPFLDPSILPAQQVYSESIVETKRCHRTIVAVINGVSVADAIRRGLVEEDQDRETHEATESESMFFPPNEDEPEVDDRARSPSPPLSSFLNPEANTFTPFTTITTNSSASQHENPPKWMTNFGEQARSPDSPNAPSKNIFGRSQASSQISSDQQDLTFGAPVQIPFQTLPQKGFASQTAFNSSISNKLENAGTSASHKWFGADTSKSSSTEAVEVSGQQNKGLSEQQQPTTVPSVAINSEPDQQKSFLEPKKSLDNLQQELPKFNFDVSQPFKFETPKSESSSDRGNLQTSTLPPQNSAFTPNSFFTPQTQPRSHISLETQQPVNSNNDRFKLSSGLSSIESDKTTYTPAQSAAVSSGGQIPSSQSPLFTFNSDTTAPQTTPQKRPSLTDISFPQVQESHLAAKSTGIVEPQSKPSESPSPTASSVPQLTAESRHSTGKPQVSEAQKLAAAEAAREKLIKDTAMIGLTQKGGILDSFLHHKLSEILYQLFRQDEDNKTQHILGKIKSRYLSRKFLLLWRDIVDRRRLRKRAERRRKMLATSIQAEQERQKRKEAELEEILEASRISKQFQEALRKESTITQGGKDNRTGREGRATDNSSQVVGRKRKSLTNSPQNSQRPNDKVLATKHKRSRTVGNIQVSRTNPHSLGNDRSGTYMNSASPLLSSSGSYHDLRKSQSNQRLDRTRTDYFRLKAMGVDPDTSLVPDTADSLASRQRRQQEERDAALARMTTRPSSNSMPASPAKGGEMSPPPPRPIAQSPLAQQVSRPSSQLTSNLSSTDPILQQLREASRAMSEGTAWFKDQASGLEKEIEDIQERESLRQSLEGSDGRSPSTSGFARSINGYEYVPPSLKAGQSLSRTEQRIRQTGAHGLANKPIGGTPRLTSPAFSAQKGSALSHSQSPEVEGRFGSRKRSIGEVDGDQGKSQHARVTSTSSIHIEQQANKRARATTQIDAHQSTNHLSSTARHALEKATYYPDDQSHEFDPSAIERHKYRNGIDAAEEVNYEEEDEEFAEEGEMDGHEEAQSEGDIYDDSEREDDDDESDEEVGATNGHLPVTGYEESVSEEEEEEEDYEDGYMNSYRQYSSKATTYSASTPATPGPGASQDDAIELSD